MTEFQQKRLKYFIKAAEKGEWVRLAPADIEILKEYECGYYDGWNDAHESYVDSSKNSIDISK